jgi:hypothetical protein
MRPFVISPWAIRLVILFAFTDGIKTESVRWVRTSRLLRTTPGCKANGRTRHRRLKLSTESRQYSAASFFVRRRVMVSSPLQTKRFSRAIALWSVHAPNFANSLLDRPFSSSRTTQVY